ncbi:MAG: CRISPR-associated endonuclease Cas1, partial [Helcococcus sp.]|nr:CRISPR-associated endonuclease Cas1 [Helcococcus sp.]
MKLKNTLYLLDENFYIHAMNNNIVIKKFGKIINRIPIHIIDSILCFNYMGVTPDVFKLCNINNVTLTFLSPSGSFMGHLVGESHGNVYLRREQYRIADDKPRAIKYARNMIFGKICNQKYVLDSFLSKNRKSCDLKFEKAIEKLTESLKLVLELEDFESLRGVEGDAARAYFSVFDQMILKDKENFYFNGRNKRPPKDRVNALLSYG